jgi:Fur family ferric uptake transcriptional regulator
MTKKYRETTWFWNQLTEYLSKENLKQSKQRNSIIEYFLEMDDHVSAEELHDYVRERNHNTGLATIYRTLNLLKDAGLVEQKQFADGKAVFEIIKPDSHHDHLICTTCERVIEFENDEIERLQIEVAKAHGLKLTHHRLDLFGSCTKEDCEFRPKAKS